MKPIFKRLRRGGIILSLLGATSCATIQPVLAPRVAQPDTPVARNFTSFSASLRCFDEMLARAGKPRTLISSTGIPDLTKKISVGGDDMLVNAINQTNRKSRAYVFVDQSLERENGQIVYLTREDDITEPRIYVRGSISQLDSNVVNDSITLSLDLENTPNPPSLDGGDLGDSDKNASRNLSVVSVDMHLVSWPSKTVIPGSSVANSMVVSGDAWGAGAEGLIRMTGFDIAIKLQRVESPGQAVRNLIELGTIELLGRHAGVPYWECLQLRTTNEKATQDQERDFVGTPHNIKITDVQQYLRRLGFLTAPVTGVLDRATRAAISEFQASEALIATGDLDFDLFERLKTRALGLPVLVEQPLKGSTLKPETTELPEAVQKRTTAAVNLSRAGAGMGFAQNKESYGVGDVFFGQLEARVGGYLACFHQSNFGPITQILPVEPDKRLRVSGETILRVPHAKSRFDIKFEGAGDTESILCLLDQSGRPVAVSRAQADSPLGHIQAKSFDALINAYRRKSRNVIWKKIEARAAR